MPESVVMVVRGYLKSAGAMLLILSILLFMPACSQKEESADNAEKLDNMAQEFMVDLRDKILPQRNNPVGMYDQGVLVTEGNNCVGLEYLGQFYQRYQDDQSAQVTIAFIDILPLVIARVGFHEGIGYYFRYELDESATIAVSSKSIDRVEVVSSQDGKKINVTLYSKKKEIAKYTFLLPKESESSE